MQLLTYTSTKRASAVLAGAAGQLTAHSNIADLLERFAPISLAQMDAVALQNRTDTKYVLSTAQLARIMGTLVGQYRVLEIDGIRENAYQTLYFDTSDFRLYMSHHAGWLNRYKVRSRRYVGTNQSFIEVKLKTNKDRTVKQRIPTDSFTMTCTSEVSDFIATHTSGEAPALEPKLWNEFSRITLASVSERERVTIDLNLRFCGNGQFLPLPGVAIVEVKQDGLSRDSALIQQLHAVGLHPTGFSKYCLGVSLLYPEVKHNRFKPKIRLVQKLMGGSSYVY